MLGFITKIIENKFAKTSLVLVGIQGLTLVVSFFGNILLAGIYASPAGFGEFNYYFSIITTIGYSAAFGLDTYLLKKNTELSLLDDRKGIAELIRKSSLVTLAFSVIAALVICGLMSWGFTKLTSTHVYVAVGILFTGLLVVRSFSLRSLGELLYSNLFNQSAKTLIFYGFVLVIHLVFSALQANIGVVSFVYASIACWFCIEVLLLQKKWWQEGYSHQFQYISLIKLGFPFFVYDLIGNLAVNIDVFMIEKLSNHFFLGNYSFYKKLSYIPIMVIVVVGTVLQTKYLEMYERGDFKNLQRTIFNTNRMIFAFAILASLFLIGMFYVFSKHIPAFQSFFAQYLGFEHYLYLLCCSEVLCAAFGPNNYFMLMLGMERLSVVINIAFCLMMVVLCALLFYVCGNIGFLIAYMVCRLGKNLACWYFIEKRTGISFFIG